MIGKVACFGYEESIERLVSTYVQSSKYKHFSPIQILHEIDLGHFEATKTAILTICAPPNFEF